MSERRVVVRRSRSIPGGYKVIRTTTWRGTPLRTGEQARAIAASYKRPHQAMLLDELIALRREALREEGH